MTSRSFTHMLVSCNPGLISAFLGSVSRIWLNLRLSGDNLEAEKPKQLLSSLQVRSGLISWIMIIFKSLNCSKIHDPPLSKMSKIKTSR